MKIQRRVSQPPSTRQFARVTALICLVMAFVALPAMSQPFDDGDWEIGVDVGLTDFDRNVSDDDSGERYGLRIGRFITNNFELELQYFESNADEQDLDITLSNVFINGVWNFFPNERFGFYTLLGIGSSSLDVDFDNLGLSVDDNGFGWQAALGLRFFFADEDRGNFRIELSSLSEDNFDSTSSHLSLTAGLGWRFGGG